MTISINDLKYEPSNLKKKHINFQVDKDTKLIVKFDKDKIYFGKKFIFDCQDYILSIKDNMYTVGKNFKFTTKAERMGFCNDLGIINTQKDSKEYKDQKTKKWEVNFRKFMLALVKNSKANVEDAIYDLVENQQVSPIKNELIQNVRTLLLNMGLCKTYNRYLLPLHNNITVPVSENDLLGIITILTKINNISSKTLKETLTFFTQETDIDYHYIRTANGYYDFNNHQFLEKSDKVLIINKETPFNYKEELIGTEPPELLQHFFDTSFKEQKWKIKGLLQIFGYMLDDGNKFQLMPILIGRPRAGKGICFKILAKLINNNTSTVDIFNVDFDSKYSQTLISSAVNIIEEFKGCKNAAEVKNYLGEGGLTIARIYEQPRYYSDLEIPKTILSTNNLGGILESLDLAFLERLKLVIEFEHTIPQKDRDPTLHLKLTESQEVMDWLLTNSLYEYSKIKNAEDFICLKTIDQMNELIDKYEHPKEYYLRTQYKYDVEAWETERDLRAFDNLVTINDIRECIYKEFDISPRQVRSMVIYAFGLQKSPHETFKDEYTIESIRDGDTVVKVIRGLVKT